MIFQQLSEQLQALVHLILKLSPEEYTQKIAHLGNVSIGSHTRHIIELLQCTLKGYDTRQIDYFNRVRNLELENNQTFAIHTLQAVQIEINRPDKYLSMLAEEEESSEALGVMTTYFREIVYNTEHTIHHLALIRVALIEMDLDLVADEFGMAYSTIKFKNTLITHK